MFEDPAGDLRLVGGKPEDNRWRRALAECQSPSERFSYERRRIVELHDQRTFGRSAVIRRKVGVEIAARQRRGRLSALGGRGGAYPLQELADDHASTEKRKTRGGETPHGITVTLVRDV